MKRNDELKVFCKNTGEYIDIDGGDTLLELYETIKGRLDLQGDAVCVLVNIGSFCRFPQIRAPPPS